MAGETFISWKLGFCREDVYYKVKEVLEKHHLPFNFSSVAIDEILNYLRYDKKVRQGNLRFVLVQDIGRVKSGVIVNMEDVSKILKEMIKDEKHR